MNTMQVPENSVSQAERGAPATAARSWEVAALEAELDFLRALYSVLSVLDALAIQRDEVNPVRFP